MFVVFNGIKRSQSPPNGFFKRVLFFFAPASFQTSDFFRVKSTGRSSLVSLVNLFHCIIVGQGYRDTTPPNGWLTGRYSMYLQRHMLKKQTRTSQWLMPRWIALTIKNMWRFIIQRQKCYRAILCQSYVPMYDEKGIFHRFDSTFVIHFLQLIDFWSYLV